MDQQSTPLRPCLLLHCILHQEAYSIPTVQSTLAIHTGHCLLVFWTFECHQLPTVCYSFSSVVLPWTFLLSDGCQKRNQKYGLLTILSPLPRMVEGLLFPLSLALLFMYFDELLCLWFLVFFAFLLNVWLFLHFFFFLGSMNAIWFPHFCHCVPSRLRREVNNLCPGQTPPVPTIGSTNGRPRKPTNHTSPFPRQLTVTSHHHNVSYLFCVRIWCLTVVSSIWTWKTVPMRWQFLARILYAPHLLWNVDPLVSRTSKGPFKTSVWVLCLNIWMNMSIYHFNLKLKAMFWS